MQARRRAIFILGFSLIVGSAGSVASGQVCNTSPVAIDDEADFFGGPVVATALFYDTLGRQTGDRPPASAWTLWDYEMPTAAYPDQAPRVTVRQCPAGQVSCTALAWQRASFDDLGRKTIEEREYPLVAGVRRAQRRMSYNAMGWVTGGSVWDEIDEVTDFEHDRFGAGARGDPTRSRPSADAGALPGRADD